MLICPLALRGAVWDVLSGEKGLAGDRGCLRGMGSPGHGLAMGLLSPR